MVEAAEGTEIEALVIHHDCHWLRTNADKLRNVWMANSLQHFCLLCNVL